MGDRLAWFGEGFSNLTLSVFYEGGRAFPACLLAFGGSRRMRGNFPTQSCRLRVSFAPGYIR